MKILLCLGSMDKGGTQRVVSNLANYFSTNNKVFVLTTSNRKSEYNLSDNIIRFSLDNNVNTSNFRRLKYIKNILNREKFDVILTMQPEPSYRILLLKKYCKCPIILSVRNDPSIEYKNIKRKILMKLLYKRANGFIFQTSDAKKYFPKKIQRKSKVIPNPLNDKFLVSPYTGKRNQAIVTVGRLTEQKNHQLLIYAFNRIIKKYPNYILKIYGEGEMEKKLKELCFKLKIENNVKFMGVSNKLEKEIYEDALFILTSDYEGMPNALMEAMALGLPCVSTDCPCGGPKELIQNGRNGLLVPVRDENRLVETIERLITDSELSSKISNNANKSMKAYAPNLILKKYEEYIKFVINLYKR